jgi:hypothetical protein
MRFKKRIAGFTVAAGLAAYALFATPIGQVIAQVIQLPLIQASHPFADLVQVIPNGAPVAGNVYEPWAGITNVYGYYKDGVGTQNQTLTLGTNVTFLSLQNASAINTLYLYLATNPFDGSMNCLFSVGGITNITMYVATGQTLDNAITTIAANTRVCYEYSASNLTWDRSQ